MMSALRLVFWETTKACNLSCTHCRAVPQKRLGPTELKTAEAFDLIDQIAEREVEHFGDAFVLDLFMRMKSQLKQCTPVGRPYFSILPDREFAFAQRANELWPAVEADDEAIAELMQKDPIFDRLA